MTIDRHDFDAKWYVSAYPELGYNEDGAFEHYVTIGQFIGYRPSEFYCSQPVEDARLLCVKEAQLSGNVVFLVSHVIDSRIKPHVRHFANYMRSKGFLVVGILACEQQDKFNAEQFEKVFDGLYTRENIGYDFAAWAHVLKVSNLDKVDTVTLTNDSILGPVNPRDMDKCLNIICESSSVFFGMTDNWDHYYHHQSYFTVIKKEGFGVLMKFMSNVRNLDGKNAVIFAYELRMLSFFKEHSIDCEIIFSIDRDKSNATIYDWHGLLDRGYPFVKMEVLRTIDKRQWIDVLKKHRYPRDVVINSLNEAGLYRPKVKKSASLWKKIFHRFMQFSAGLIYRELWDKHSKLATKMRISNCNDAFTNSIWGTWCPYTRR